MAGLIPSTRIASTVAAVELNFGSEAKAATTAQEKAKAQQAADDAAEETQVKPEAADLAPAQTDGSTATPQETVETPPRDEADLSFGAGGSSRDDQPLQFGTQMRQLRFGSLPTTDDTSSAATGKPTLKQQNETRQAEDDDAEVARNEADENLQSKLDKLKGTRELEHTQQTAESEHGVDEQGSAHSSSRTTKRSVSKPLTGDKGKSHTQLDIDQEALASRMSSGELQQDMEGVGIQNRGVQDKEAQLRKEESDKHSSEAGAATGTAHATPAGAAPPTNETDGVQAVDSHAEVSQVFSGFGVGEPKTAEQHKTQLFQDMPAETVTAARNIAEGRIGPMKDGKVKKQQSCFEEPPAGGETRLLHLQPIGTSQPAAAVSGEDVGRSPLDHIMDPGHCLQPTFETEMALV